MKKPLIRLLILCFTLSIFSYNVHAGQSVSKDIDTFTISLGNDITLSMTIAPFNPSSHKITRCKILDWEGICLIDEKPVFGTDWQLPEKQLTRALLNMAGNSIELDVSCMFDPWFGKPKHDNFSIETVEGGYVLRGKFSDGAGSYEAEWLIIQNTSVRTKIAKGEC